MNTKYKKVKPVLGFSIIFFMLGVLPHMLGITTPKPEFVTFWLYADLIDELTLCFTGLYVIYAILHNVWKAGGEHF